MNNAKHTPGPWSIGRGADGCPLVFVPVHVSEGSGHGIAHVNRLPRMGSVRGDMDANAALISAAPDMLAALRAVVRAYEHGGMIDSINQALAAIARADGGAPANI